MNTIPDFSLKLLKNKELIALNQDVLGLQAHVVQHENESYVLLRYHPVQGFQKER